MRSSSPESSPSSSLLSTNPSHRVARVTYSKKGSRQQKRKTQDDQEEDGGTDGSGDDDGVTSPSHKRARAGSSSSGTLMRQGDERPRREQPTRQQSSRGSSSAQQASRDLQRPTSATSAAPKDRAAPPHRSFTENLTPSTPPSQRVSRRPLTPTSSPKDLSALFAQVASSGASPGILDADDTSPHRSTRPTGLRRMLTKTQSLGVKSPSKSRLVDESSPFRPSPSSRLARTQSLPSTPSKSPPRDLSPNPAALLVPSAPAHDGSGGKAKRIYGKTRTVRVEMEDGEAGDIFGVKNPVHHEGAVKESYAELRKMYEVDNTAEGETSGSLFTDLLAARAPQPVSDMRSKGENRRFMDEVAYLVDPVADDNTRTSLRRSSAMDVLRNMCDESWMEKMKICGQTERIWDAFAAAREGGDDVMDAVCILFLVKLARSSSGIDGVVRVHGEDCVSFLIIMIGVGGGSLDAPSIKPRCLKDIYTELDMPWPSLSPSTRRLAAYTLRMICDSHWDSVSTVIAAQKAVTKVMKSYANELSAVLGRFDLYEKGLPLTTPGTVDLVHLHLCLRIISTVVLHSSSDRELLADDSLDFAKDVVSGIIAYHAVALDDRHEDRVLGAKCLVESLKLLVNMSNISLRWSKSTSEIPGSSTALMRMALGREKLVAAMEEQNGDEKELSSEDHGNRGHAEDAVSGQDLLCLVLAALCNAFLADQDFTASVADMVLSASCTSKHACLRGCRCADAKPLSQHLVAIYLENVSQSQAEAEIIASYVSLLLARLLVAAPASCDSVLVALPGSSKVEQVEGLLGSLGELRGLQTFLHKLAGVAADERVSDEVEETEKDLDVIQIAITEVRDLFLA